MTFDDLLYTSCVLDFVEDSRPKALLNVKLSMEIFCRTIRDMVNNSWSIWNISPLIFRQAIM